MGVGDNCAFTMAASPDAIHFQESDVLQKQEAAARSVMLTVGNEKWAESSSAKVWKRICSRFCFGFFWWVLPLVPIVKSKISVSDCRHTGCCLHAFASRTFFFFSRSNT